MFWSARRWFCSARSVWLCFGKLCRSGAKALLLGFLAGTIGHAAALYWLALPMSVVGGLCLPLSSVLAFLVAALLATQCGLFCLLSHFFWKEESISSSCALGLAWFLLEYAYAYGIGFPWLPLSGALAVWPVLVQPACLVGAGLTGGLVDRGHPSSRRLLPRRRGAHASARAFHLRLPHRLRRLFRPADAGHRQSRREKTPSPCS